MVSYLTPNERGWRCTQALVSSDVTRICINNKFLKMLLYDKNAYSEVIQLPVKKQLGNSDVSQDALLANQTNPVDS